MRSRQSRQLGRLQTFEAIRALHAQPQVAGEAAADAARPPECSWRDYALLLLHVAAEIEHSLMVQYLYAAYTLGGPQVTGEPERARVRSWRDTILGIAKEEMGHLVTVQNVIRLLGGSLQFDREDYPWDSDFYPFAFQLERLTGDSLAKYIYAEMPANWPGPEADAIKKRAEGQGGSSRPPHQVGELYEALIGLLQDPSKVRDAEFHTNTYGFQASWDEWGRGYQQGERAAQDAGATTPDVIVRAVASRDAAVQALQAIAAQGESPESPNAPDSHFARFLAIYREFEPITGWTPTRPAPTNPRTAAPAVVGALIVNATSVQWAHLFNVRYRALLVSLSHAYRLSGALVRAGEMTARGAVVHRAFGEMYNLRAIAGVLLESPLGADAQTCAGPPFEMPYTLALPDEENDVWRLHLDLLDASAALASDLLRLDPARRDYLAALRAADAKQRSTIEVLLGRSRAEVRP